MGWLSVLCNFFINAFASLNAVLKSAFHFMMERLYLMVLPLIMALKGVYDFVRILVDSIISSMQGMDSVSGGGGGLAATGTDIVSFVNYAFPLDEILQGLIVLFTFWIGCHVIATIRGIKQTILF